MTQTHAVDVAAPADLVFSLVVDPMQMPRWSPECVACRWTEGATAPAVGARYIGSNRNGSRRWRTRATIVELVQGAGTSVLSWEVTYLRLPVARWTYRVEVWADGCRLTESVIDRRGRLLRIASPTLTGSRHRSARNGDTMHETLERVKRAAEDTRSTR